MNCPSCKKKLKCESHEVKWVVDGHGYDLPLLSFRCGDCEKIYCHMKLLREAEEKMMVSILESHRVGSEALRLLRKLLGLKGYEAAALLGQTPETVSRWERGQKAVEPLAFAWLAARFFVARGDAYAVERALALVSHPVVLPSGSQVEATA